MGKIIRLLVPRKIVKSLSIEKRGWWLGSPVIISSPSNAAPTMVLSKATVRLREGDKIKSEFSGRIQIKTLSIGKSWSNWTSNWEKVSQVAIAEKKFNSWVILSINRWSSFCVKDIATVEMISGSNLPSKNIIRRNNGLLERYFNVFLGVMVFNKSNVINNFSSCSYFSSSKSASEISRVWVGLFDLNGWSNLSWRLNFPRRDG